MFGKFYFSIIYRVIQLFIWILLLIVIVSPSSTLVAQDDVEEYWGDDEEYDDYEILQDMNSLNLTQQQSKITI